MIRDPALPAWRGRYVFGDFCRGVLQTAVLSSGRARSVTDRKLEVDSLSSFGEDARGRVYATSLDGPVYRLVQGDHADARAQPEPAHALGHQHLGRRRAGWSIPGPAIAAHLDAVAAAVGGRGGPTGSCSRTTTPTTPRPRARCARASASRSARRRRCATATRSGRSPCSPSPATPTTTSCSSPAAPRSPATPCSARAACSSAGACASTSTACGALRALDLERIYPGHGDEVTDPNAKLDEYLAHRAERERKLLAALDGGRSRARTSCSTPPGPTRRPPSARSPRSRCARTWRSCAKRAAFRCDERPLRVSPRHAHASSPLLVGALGPRPCPAIVVAVRKVSRRRERARAAAEPLAAQNMPCATQMRLDDAPEDGEDVSMTGTALSTADGGRMNDVTTSTPDDDPTA